MKPAVEVSITSWKKNVVKPGQEYGRVLLMPGTGYNCDRPLLYWSAQALVEAGWRIDRMNVRNASDDLSTVIPVLNQAIDGWVAAARESGAGKPVIPGMALPPMILLPCWPMAQLARRTVIPTPRPALACC
jgi:hypothetical protein